MASAKDSGVRVRFAPSPTGYLHIGGARTALFNYLYAKRNGGKFVLRIEDTDTKREIADSIDRILQDMRWLGIQWDEGPVCQTDRLHIYEEYARRLEESGKAYKCYCTPEELEEKRQAMRDQNLNPGYDGACRNLTPEQRKIKEGEGRKPCLRFRVPDETITVPDLIRGDVVYEKGFTGDFVIMKADGKPSYNFAVVVDDHEMGISLVMRGDEHLVNTPRQILLYRAMGFELPQFAHISMILSPDRKKLSKRHGTVAVDIFKDEGYLPGALVNYLALLGWSPPGEGEIFSLNQLSEQFSLDRIAKNPAVYDVTKLRWMNGQYIQKMTAEELYPLVLPHLQKAGYTATEPSGNERNRILKIIDTVKGYMELLPDETEKSRIFFDENIDIKGNALESMSWDTTPAVLRAFREVLDSVKEITPDNFMPLIKEIQKKSGVKGKNLYVPIRIGITGEAHGPEMAQIMTLISVDSMKKRLAHVMETAGNLG